MSGLEILGAVASSIALAQAVQGTIKAVNLLREIRQIQQQCDDLKNEVVTIDGFILEAMRLTGLPSRPQPPGTTQEHPMVSRTVQELQGILEALNQIVSKYSTDRKWHEKITRKMQWLSEGKKIEELARKAQNTKLNLHLAITLRTSSSVDRIGTQQEVILHSIRQRTVYCLEKSQHNPTRLLNRPLHDPVRTSAIGPVEGQAEEIELEGDSCSETGEVSTQSAVEPHQLRELQSLSLADKSDGCAISIQEESYVSLKTIQPLGTRRCGQDCQCRCHGTLGDHDSYSWISAVLGTWRVRNQSVDGTCELQCGPRTGPEFEYRFPRWLWPGVIPLGGHQRGRQSLTFSLRAPRTISWKEDFWRWIDHPSLLQQSIREGLVYLPDDVDELGIGLIETAIIEGAYESIRILLELWKNVLPQQGLPRRVGYQVNIAFALRPSMVPDSKDRHVLEKVLSFVQLGRSLRRIHVAAIQNHTVQMRQVLREQPETIHELDGCGLSAIHHAALRNNVDVLEQLMLAGAHTCSRGSGETPLMMAAVYGCRDAVQTLLRDKQCLRAVDLQDSVGRGALHRAVITASPECVRMLLEAGASVEQRDFFDRTQLHYLALSEADQQAAHEVIHLFEERNGHLDARGSYGRTTLMEAVVQNNVPVLRALVDAGASLNTTTINSHNILHLIACYAHLEAMSYLGEQDLTLVDSRLRGVDGHTPLGILGWCWEAEDLQLRDNQRRPGTKEQKVFISLYFDLLSRDLLRHLSTLKQLLRAARRRDSSAASKHTNRLVEESEARNERDLSSWYRGIISYIKDENWPVVVEIVQEEMRETKGELGLAAIVRDAPLGDPVMRGFFYR